MESRLTHARPKATRLLAHCHIMHENGGIICNYPIDARGWAMVPYATVSGHGVLKRYGIVVERRDEKETDDNGSRGGRGKRGHPGVRGHMDRPFDRMHPTPAPEMGRNPIHERV